MLKQMSLTGYIKALGDENKMLREFWSTLGMPEPEYDRLGTEFTRSKKRREDFLRNVIDDKTNMQQSSKSNSLSSNVPFG